MRMFNNPYVNAFNTQSTIDHINSINNQIAELEMKKAQAFSPQPITQNFQLAPNNNTIRYADSLEQVQKDLVIGDTPYFSKDMSIVWIKNSKGEIKSYQLTEIVQLDEKDKLIESLTKEIQDLKKERLKNEQSNDYDVVKPTKNDKSTTSKSNYKFNE